MKIFVIREGKQAGPYSIAQINAFINFGWIKSNDSAWFEGCPTWILVKNLPGVQINSQSSSPTIPNIPPVQRPSPPSKQKSLICKVCETGELKKKRINRYSDTLFNLGIVILVLDLLILICFLLWLIISATKDNEEYQKFVKSLDVTSVNLLVLSWIGLLIVAFILKMKKQVLQCNHCESVINTS